MICSLRKPGTAIMCTYFSHTLYFVHTITTTCLDFDSLHVRVNICKSCPFIAQMESIRKRFMIQYQPKSQSTPQNADNRATYSTAIDESQKNHDSDSPIVVEISQSKKIILCGGVVTLYNDLVATIVSTTSAEEYKILALQAMNDSLRQNGRDKLDAHTEKPVADRILETFESRQACLDSIGRCCSVAEHRRVLLAWTYGVWGEEEEAKEEARDLSEERSDGSLFTDSDVEALPNNRVSPMTLRPRKNQVLDPIVNSDFNGSIQSPIFARQDGAQTKYPSRPLSSPESYSGSRVPEKIEHGALKLGRPRHVEPSKPSRHEYKKRHSRISEMDRLSPSEDKEHFKVTKRLKISHLPAKTHENSSEYTGRGPSESSTIKEFTSSPEEPESIFQPATAADFVAKYWKETNVRFPSDVKELPLYSRLAYFFTQHESMRNDYESILAQENERRYQMCLLAEKMKLMNSPIERGKESATDG